MLRTGLDVLDHSLDTVFGSTTGTEERGQCTFFTPARLESDTTENVEISISIGRVPLQGLDGSQESAPTYRD
jgi:hypothetical protein